MVKEMSFAEFVERFSEAMGRSGRADVTCKKYARIASKLAGYANERGQKTYTVDFAHQFLADIYPVDSELQTCQWTLAQTTARRAVKLMDAFALNGVALPDNPSPTAGLDERSIALAESYSNWLKQKGYAASTICGHVSVVRGFMRYLIQVGRKFEEIMDKDIVGYLNASDGYSRSTISASIYSLKHFAQFLLDKKIIAKDIVPLLPQGHKYRLANIVSVWKPGNIEKILGAVDRGSPIGRRDYAIILIAARLGLRQKDIFGLRLDSVDWRGSRIETTQSKTGEPISLPLPEDVGWAIIDYLKYGRPQIDSPYIFVCHSKNAWGGQMKGTFDTTLSKYVRQARVRLSEGQKHGMHSLRHTLACRLLEAKTPLPVISEILGQISPDAIEKYLKVDVEMLRQCALDPQEVFENADRA